LRQPEGSIPVQSPKELNNAFDRGIDPTAEAPRPWEAGAPEPPEPAVQPSGAGGGWSPPVPPSQEDMNNHSPGITVKNFEEGDLLASVEHATSDQYHNHELYDSHGLRKPVRALHDAAQWSRSYVSDTDIVNVMRPLHSDSVGLRLLGLVHTYGSPFTYPDEEYWGRDAFQPGQGLSSPSKRKLIMLPDAAAAAQAYRDWLNYEDTTVTDETGKVHYLGNIAGTKRTGDDGEPQYSVNNFQRNWITKQLSEGVFSGTVDRRGNVIKEPSILGYHRTEAEGGDESYADVLAEIANERHVQTAIGKPWGKPPQLAIPGKDVNRLRNQLRNEWRTMDKIEKRIKDMWSSTPDVTRNPEYYQNNSWGQDPNHPDSHSFTDMDSDVSPTTLLQTVRTHQLGKGRGHVGVERDENGKRIPLPLDAEGEPDYSSVIYDNGNPWRLGAEVPRHKFKTGSLLHTQPLMDTSNFEGSYDTYRSLEAAVERASQLSTELANRPENRGKTLEEMMPPSQMPHPGMAGSPEHPNKVSQLKAPPEAPTAPDVGGPTEPPVVPPDTATEADPPKKGWFAKRGRMQNLVDALQQRHSDLTAADQEPPDEPPPTGADRLVATRLMLMLMHRLINRRVALMYLLLLLV